MQNTDQNVRAITVCQPYAELIARGDDVKPIENRTWFTSYRGTLFIHAGKSRSWLDDCEAYDICEDELTFGAIVAVADMWDCIPKHRLPAEWRAHPHANGPFCLMLRGIRRLREPVSCSGAQGLWIPSPSLVALVRARLGVLSAA